MATFFGWKIASIDVTQAFLQADDLQKKDKHVVVLPPYITISHPTQLKKCAVSGTPIVEEKDATVYEWSEYNSKTKSELNQGFKIGLVTHKPLNGGRDAPLGWYLKICAALRCGGWKHCRTDVCTFAKYIINADGKVIKPSSIIIVHVGDFLIDADPSDLRLFGRVMTQFRTAEMCKLNNDSSMEYLGMQIRRGKNGRYGAHQQPYCSQLMSIKIEEVVQNNVF